MEGNAKGGHNTLIAGTGDKQTLMGDADAEVGGNAKGGHNLLIGGSGNDTLVGDSHYLTGNAEGGFNKLIAGGGDDLLWGIAPIYDTTGKIGANTFVFSMGGTSADHEKGNCNNNKGPVSIGNDIIFDFRADTDKLVLDLAHGVKVPEVTNHGGFIDLVFDAHDSILFQNIAFNPAHTDIHDYISHVTII